MNYDEKMLLFYMVTFVRLLNIFFAIQCGYNVVIIHSDRVAVN
jgi:hypothetical protein